MGGGGGQFKSDLGDLQGEGVEKPQKDDVIYGKFLMEFVEKWIF